MKQALEQIKASALEDLASCADIKSLEGLKVKYLGKKGEITSILKQMGKLSPEERPVIGQLANEVRADIQNQISLIGEKLKQQELVERLKSETIDVTMPGKLPVIGKSHPISQVMDEIKEIFLGMGFDLVNGPEVESDYYNFEALNIPQDHPARDIQDTFYIDEKTVLRTATSPVQIRAMEKRKPPIRVISSGRVYRSDALDATHSPVFHQVEGLVVDKNVTMGDLKGTLDMFLKALYGEDTQLRFRPHYFPFTEPSAEIDIMCFNCHGKGCRLCKGEGWIEVLGCGMVHPKVLEYGGVDPHEYTGFAFGMGLERIAMRRYSINDIRMFFENDLRFLDQF